MKCLTIVWMFIFGLYYVCSGQKIDSVEYFIDSDPGFGAATKVNVQSPGNKLALNFTVNTDMLSNGFHSLVIRAHDDARNWGFPVVQPFYKYNFPNAKNLKISKAEYFIDTDPGSGKATVIPVKNPSANISLSFNVSKQEYTPGFHNMVIRAADEVGKWSQTHVQNFYATGNTLNSVPDLVKAEYYLDTDPGFGSGISIPVSTPGKNKELTFNIDTKNLGNGFHNLVVRVCNKSENWSICNQQFFYLYKDLLPHITRVEYFIDNDPGKGNATAIGSPHQSNVTIDFLASLNGIAAGDHIMYIRSKDLIGRWGPVFMHAFKVLKTDGVDVKVVNLFKLYPNPTSGNFSIELAEMQQTPVLMTMYDLSGKKLYENTLRDRKNQISVDFKAGTYMLEITWDDKRFVQKLIIKP